MNDHQFQNPNAAWWTPRRFAALFAAMLVLGVLGVVDAAIQSGGSGSAVIGLVGALLVAVSLLMFAVLVRKQGWAWLLAKDNTTTKWQN